MQYRGDIHSLLPEDATVGRHPEFHAIVGAVCRGRCRFMWGYNVKMNLKQIWRRGMDRFSLASDGNQIETTCEQGNEHFGPINCLENRQ
jgi:hypothetical protein